MSKKIPLILIVGILGLLSAGTMWFMQHGSVSPMLGGVYLGQSEPSMGRGMMPAQDNLMYTEKMEPYGVGMMPVPTLYPYDDALDVKTRSVQKFAYHSLIVDDVSEYLRKTREYIQSIGGTVLSYDQGTSEYNYIHGNINARIPEDKFDEAVARITQDVKKVTSESISAQDVTGEVLSVEEQLQSLNDTKAEREIALEEAETETEKRRVELEIDRLERQIEVVQRSQESIAEKVEYATLSISVSNKEYFNPGGGRSPSDVLREAWYSLRTTGFGILYFLIWVAVYAIIWIPVLLLARWIWGKVRPAAPKS